MSKSRIWVVPVLLAVIFLVVGVKAPRFFQPESIDSILQWAPLLIVVGLGEMLVIVTRGVDVSVGSMTGLAAIVVGMTFRSHPDLSLAVGMTAGVAVGLCLGAVNGLLVAWAQIPPIVATLGTLSLYRGVVFIVSKGVQVDGNDLPPSLVGLAGKGPLTWHGITLCWLAAIAIAVALAAAWAVRRTRFCRDVYAIGSNPKAAHLRGISVRSRLFAVYVLAGALCGLGGSFYASRYGFVNPATAGQGLELIVIAAIVIGGTNVMGGSGSVLGVVLGCLFLAVLDVALAILGVGETWRQLAYGVVILVAVLVDSFLGRARSSARSLA